MQLRRTAKRWEQREKADEDVNLDLSKIHKTTSGGRYTTI